MEIPLIIPVYNHPEYTKVLLDTLYQPGYHGAKIRPVIVNNGCRLKTSQLIADWSNSWDEQKDDVKADVLKPILVARLTNGGYAGGVNAGLAAIKGAAWPDIPPNVCIMHNDCIPFPGWLGEMSACLAESDEDVAVIVPRTDYANEGSPCVYALKEAFQAVKLPTKDMLTAQEIQDDFKKLYPDTQAVLKGLADDAAVRISYTPEISSFCMLVRGTILRDYPWFDEDFWPRGWEDKLWFQHFEREGLVCCLSNRSFVHHYGNATSDGRGFCFPDNMKINEEKYRAKRMAEIKNKPQVANSEKPCPKEGKQV